MNWVETTIGDLGSVITGKTPSTKNRDFYDGDYPFVTPTDLDWQSYYVRETHSTITELARDKHKNQFIPKNATVFTCIGNTIGKIGLSSADCMTNQQINTVVPSNDHDPRFIYYLLNYYRPTVRSIGLSGGAAQPIINKSTFSEIKVNVPSDKDIEEGIADTLAAYDSLIENNKRRIALLEDAARQLYKEWFVRFRFPGHEHVKIKDGIPVGWNSATASEALLVNPKTVAERGAPLTYVPMSCLSETGMVIDSAEFEVRTKHTSVRFRRNDTLFARITPCLENGKTGFVDFLSQDEIACGSTEFIVLRGAQVSPYFTYLLSRDEAFRGNAIKSMIGSSGRQRVQTTCFDRFIVPVPPNSIAEQFDDIVSSSFSQIENLSSQNKALAQARDLLLPKLMSGEIPV